MNQHQEWQDWYKFNAQILHTWQHSLELFFILMICLEDKEHIVMHVIFLTIAETISSSKIYLYEHCPKAFLQDPGPTD